MAAVAECIRNSAERLSIDPTEVLVLHRHTHRRLPPSETARRAVQAVFDGTAVILGDQAELMYNPAVCGPSPFHESQVYIGTVGPVRFFAFAGSGGGETP